MLAHHMRESGYLSRYWATGWTTEESWFDVRKGRRFMSSPKHPHRFRGPSYLRFIGTGVAFSRGKEAGSWSDCLTPYSAAVKNECSCTTTLPYVFMVCTRKPLPLLLVYRHTQNFRTVVQSKCIFIGLNCFANETEPVILYVLGIMTCYLLAFGSILPSCTR